MWKDKPYNYKCDIGVLDILSMKFALYILLSEVPILKNYIIILLKVIIVFYWVQLFL